MEAEQAAFFSNQSDFLVNLAVATDDYLQMFTDENLRWPMEPPYVSMFLIDYQFMGYCIEISFEAIRQEMIKSGKIKEQDPDSKFTYVMWLRVMHKLYQKVCN